MLDCHKIPLSLDIIFMSFDDLFISEYLPRIVSSAISNLQRMELAVISNFHHRRPIIGIEPRDPSVLSPTS